MAFANIGQLRVGKEGYLMVTVGHPRVTRGNHRLNIGLQVTSLDIGQLRVGKEGYLMVTVGQQG